MGELNLNYEPVSFLRCHSNKDSADVKTQVWHCAFEPTFNSSSKLVATCGGNSVCVIDCTTGTVVSKFYTKINHLLFTLAWGVVSIGRNISNVIICGGTKSTIYVLDPCLHKCLLVENFHPQNKTINAILVHPSQKYMFFCATDDGIVRCCKILVDANKKCVLEQINMFSSDSENFDLSFCETTNSLLVSCNNGLSVFHFDETHSCPKRINLILPENPNNKDSTINNQSNLVDSVEVLRYGFFACKCALHGNIYVCDLKPVIEKLTNTNISSYKVTPSSTLEWSSTDNYFMYMGVSPDKTLLGCGDDKGSLWLYDISDICDDKTKKPKHSIIPWPNLIDHCNDKKRKLSLNTYDIVVDKIAVSHYCKYLVAVTNNNLVCIWKSVS